MKQTIFILSLLFISILSFSQKNIGDEYSVDTITFEDTCLYLKIDTSATNIWQVGEPYKTFFHESFSLPNAIVTDTLNNYPINNYSYFDLIIDENSFLWGLDQMCFEFKHKIDTDTLKDGGYITISYDKGVTWYNIIEDTTQNYQVSPVDLYFDMLNQNTYLMDDTLYNGEFGFSGKLDWTTTRFSWTYIPCKNKQNRNVLDTILIRFNFISDDINSNKEGWMIDNIRLFNVDMGGDVETIRKQQHSILRTNPVKDKSLIIFDRRYNHIVVEVFDIEGKQIQKEILRNQKEYVFSKNNLRNGIYFIKLVFDNKFSETHKLIISE